jgi:hypothetical protein
MKKILIPIVLIALYLNPLSAQIKKGSWMIGGSMGFNRLTTPLTAWIHPKFGYFTTDRLLIGAAANVESFNYNPDALYATKSIQTQMLPFARFYFTPTHRFKFFNEIEAEWSSNYNKVINSPFPTMNSWSKYDKFWLRNRFGVNYFLTDNIAVEAYLPYTLYYKEDSISFFKPQVEYRFPKFTFSPTFRMRLFLNTAKQSSDILAEKYLKKGNKTYGMQGNISLAEGSFSTLIPNIGYFITDKWMIGSTLWLFLSNNGTVSANIGPEIRFYQPISEKMQWLTQASTQLSLFGSLKYSYTQIGTGLNRFVSENISVQCLLNSDLFFLNDKLTMQPNLSIGFQYFMSKK